MKKRVTRLATRTRPQDAPGVTRFVFSTSAGWITGFVANGYDWHGVFLNDLMIGRIFEDAGSHIGWLEGVLTTTNRSCIGSDGSRMPGFDATDVFRGFGWSISWVFAKYDRLWGRWETHPVVRTFGEVTKADALAYAYYKDGSKTIAEGEVYVYVYGRIVESPADGSSGTDYTQLVRWKFTANVVREGGNVGFSLREVRGPFLGDNADTAIPPGYFEPDAFGISHGESASYSVYGAPALSIREMEG